MRGRKEELRPEAPGSPPSKGHDILVHSRQEEQRVLSDMCKVTGQAPLPEPRRHLPAAWGTGPPGPRCAAQDGHCLLAQWGSLSSRALG